MGKFWKMHSSRISQCDEEVLAVVRVRRSKRAWGLFDRRRNGYLRRWLIKGEEGCKSVPKWIWNHDHVGFCGDRRLFTDRFQAILFNTTSSSQYSAYILIFYHFVWDNVTDSHRLLTLALYHVLRCSRTCKFSRTEENIFKVWSLTLVMRCSTVAVRSVWKDCGPVISFQDSFDDVPVL